MDLDVSGVLSKLLRAKTNGRKGALKGAYRAGEHVLGVSNERVPHEEGDLERSGGVSQAGDVTAISYDTDYAVVQHEDLSLNHDDGRQAKYLESALISERETIKALIAQGAKEDLL